MSDGMGLVERLRQRRVTNWAHSTGATPKAIGTKPDADCRAAADEIERLRADLEESSALRERMADILNRTAVALRGPEPPLTRWGWHDLPGRAAAAVAGADRNKDGT